jgi:PKD repeat protein
MIFGPGFFVGKRDTIAMTSLAQRVVMMMKMLLFLATVLPFYVGTTLAADLPIYTDSLAAGWDDWSWATMRNFANTSPVHSGSDSLAVTFNSGWAGLYLHAGSAIDTSGYDQLRFWIHGGSVGSQKLLVVANGDGGNTVAVTAQADNWAQVSVPLTALGSPASLTDLYWQDTTNGAQPVFYLDDITLVAGPPPPPPALSINAGAGRHPISDDIYGMNYADEELAAELRLPVRRWGGNSTSRYNWQIDTHNTGSDYYFENIPDDATNPNLLPDGSSADQFVEQDRRTGTKTLMTVPLIGWTPKQRLEDHPYDCGFKVSKYGAQQSTDYWDADCGNGVYSNGSTITGNNPTDTSTAIDPAFVTGWISHLTGKYGFSANGGVVYYDLDNEPMLWNSTHRDVHPNPTTYDEMRDRTYAYAAALKAADPSAKTLGPVLWGWCAYFYSALDECGAKNGDYNAHNQTYFVPWYLQQMKAYEEGHGVRILDYLDLHSYPAADNVSLSPAGNATTQALRLRSTRLLWDPTYTDESWIPDKVRLIPRMKEWVDTNYPGTKLAITEYNWGGLESINGALAQADVLGIFGREGLDLATLWGLPTSTQPGAFAFRIFRNYDGNGGRFGETGIQSTSTDQGRVAVYAAERSSDHAVTVVVINKTASDQTSAITLAGFTPQSTASVYRYSPASLSTITHPADQALTAGGFSTTFPANSITLYVIPPLASANRTLTVVRSGSGDGNVTPETGNIAWSGNTGTATYPADTLVKLDASPVTGSAFIGWSGACTGNTTPCTFTISSDTSATARFDLLADFTAAPTTGPAPLYVCFSDASINDPVSWLWDLGDGSTAYDRNPCHIYKSTQSYTVSLTARGTGGGVTRMRNGYIAASACANQPVKVGGSSQYFPNIQNAFENAASGSTLLLQALDFSEEPILANNTSVTLSGGYECDFSPTPAASVIRGSLTVGEGALILDRIVIQ